MSISNIHLNSNLFHTNNIFSRMFPKYACNKKSHSLDGTVENSRCKALKSLGMRRTYKYVRMTKAEAQRSPSAVLRAASLSSGRWTFYEAVKIQGS